MNLGDKVRAAREQLGMTQRDLAKAAQVSNGFVAVVESGGGENHGVALLRRIAGALKMPLSELLDEAPAKRKRGAA